MKVPVFLRNVLFIDPYFKILRMHKNGESSAVYQSPKIMKNLNPSWESIEISLQKLCNDNVDRILLFEVWDWDRK